MRQKAVHLYDHAVPSLSPRNGICSFAQDGLALNLDKHSTELGVVSAALRLFLHQLDSLFIPDIA